MSKAVWKQSEERLSKVQDVLQIYMLFDFHICIRNLVLKWCLYITVVGCIPAEEVTLYGGTQCSCWLSILELIHPQQVPFLFCF